MRTLLVCIFTLCTLATAHANLIAISIDGRKLRLLREDVHVILNSDAAEVSGRFEFSPEIPEEKIEPSDRHATRITIRVPVMVPADTVYSHRENLAIFRVRIKSGVHSTLAYEYREGIPYVELPIGVSFLVFGAKVLRIVEDGRIIVGFSYRQPYISGAFHYLPVFGQRWGSPIDAKEPRSPDLQIHIRDAAGGQIVVNGDLDMLRNDGMITVFPRHLQVISVDSPKAANKAPEPTPTSVTPRAMEGVSK